MDKPDNGNSGNDSLPNAAGESRDDVTENTGEEQPIEAKLVQPSDIVTATAVTDESVRVGSPFAVDPVPLISGAAIAPAQYKEVVYDVGPLKYTAIGAVSAAVMVLFFGALSVWYFPSGGSLVAGLGCALAIFGLYSPKRYRIVATFCLIAHLVLFLLCFARSVTV